MISLQFHGSIYYRVYKDVAPGKELLVGCEEEQEYPIELGITLRPGSTSSVEDTDEETDDGSIFAPTNS